MSLDVANAADWLKGVQNGLADLELDSEEALAELAAGISKNMRDDAPVMDPEERRRRQQGEKGREAVRRTPGKTTIRFRRGRDERGFYIDVGPSRGAFYLAFLEYGTSKIAARPFLRPAIEKAIAAWGTAGSRGAR